MNPERVGPYRIVRHIGAGGMGDVFEAVHEQLNRCVALKLLKPGAVQGKEAGQRFKREMQTGASLVHPNLVRLYDGGTLDGTLYMAMELVRGETLAQRLGRERPPVGWSLRIAKQVADGLACLHERDICHRDVKPQNILLDQDGTAKLADFGLVRTMEGTAITTDGGLLGTLPFLSPEVLAGEPASPASDVWAFGCVLYTMLTGRGPFNAAGPGEWFEAIMREPIRPVSELAAQVSPAVSQLVERLLDRNREARLASAMEVSAALARLATSPASRPGIPRVKSSGATRASAPPDLSRVRYSALGVMAVLAVVTGVALLGQRGGFAPPPPPPSSIDDAFTDPRAVGGQEWTRDVVARADALRDRDTRQSVAVVLDAMQELGRAAPEVRWPRALDLHAKHAAGWLQNSLMDMKQRGREAYAAATMEFAGDIPRRERVYANEYRARVRDVRAILPAVARTDAPFAPLAHACATVEFMLQTEFRLLDDPAATSVEADMLAISAKLDSSWRGPFLRSFLRGRPDGVRKAERRRAIALCEQEAAARAGGPTETDVHIWYELQVFALGLCEGSRDHATAREIFEHATEHRRTLPPALKTDELWAIVRSAHQRVANAR